MTRIAPSVTRCPNEQHNRASERRQVQAGSEAGCRLGAGAPPDDGGGPPTSSLTDLVVITGFSGAGKSTAMQLFEDAGYFCVDNLPPEMIRSLAELFVHEGSKVERAAVVSDVRGGEYFDGLVAVLDELEAAGVEPRVLFLDADEQTLLHPLQGDAPPPPARARRAACRRHRRASAQLLEPLRERADVVHRHDRACSRAMLRRKVADEMLAPTTPRRLAVTFTPSATSTGRRATPTCPSTCASCPTRTTSPTCARSPASTSGSSTTSAATALEEFYERPDPAARLPAAAVRRRGQGAPHGRDRLHRRAAPLGGRSPSTSPTHFRADDDYLVEVAHRDVDKAPRA